jgi:simple sugar transport system permease protein
MGLNFGIVLGAMAGQIAIIAVTHFKIGGIAGFGLAALLTIPIALLFGYFTAKLLNKTKGQEMISGMILGFFANGLYQLLFLFLVGTIIPMDNPTLVLSAGIGLKNTIDLSGPQGTKYALDALAKIPFIKSTIVFALAGTGYYVFRILQSNKDERLKMERNSFIIRAVLFAALLIISFYVSTIKSLINNISLPLATVVVVGLLCVFNVFILKTKAGQDFRSVGQDMNIAKISGIPVDKIRIRAILISTVLAGWGQLIFLQNIGTLNTYGSHEQVGTFAIAALLIGGASVTKATIGQAIIGTALFHTLFIVSPQAGKNLFGNAQIGEYFRVFVAYGVIGVSLGLHAWKQLFDKKNKK